MAILFTFPDPEMQPVNIVTLKELHQQPPMKLFICNMLLSLS
jgi:hypothetical protein